MDELEALRQQRLEGLQRQMQQQSEEDAEAQQQISQLESVVKSKMTKDAIARYSTLKSAHPEKAIQTLVLLAQLIEAKQVDIIDDQHLKMLLVKINPEKREFKITRK
jgi:DNA-binding TFAR19-related protein (PDSD5 family)